MIYLMIAGWFFVAISCFQLYRLKKMNLKMVHALIESEEKSNDRQEVGVLLGAILSRFADEDDLTAGIQCAQGETGVYSAELISNNTHQGTGYGETEIGALANLYSVLSDA